MECKTKQGTFLMLVQDEPVLIVKNELFSEDSDEPRDGVSGTHGNAGSNRYTYSTPSDPDITFQVLQTDLKSEQTEISPFCFSAARQYRGQTGKIYDEPDIQERVAVAVYNDPYVKTSVMNQPIRKEPNNEVIPTLIEAPKRCDVETNDVGIATLEGSIVIGDRDSFKDGYFADDVAQNTRDRAKSSVVPAIDQQPRAPCQTLLTHSCQVCSSVFTLEHDITKHFFKHISNMADLRECFCGKRFSILGKLLIHVRSHLGKRYCPTCSKGFRDSTDVRRHMRKCHAEKPGKRVSCPVCHGYFSNDIELSRHKVIHRFVNCNICNEKFRTEDHLMKHFSTHLSIMTHIRQCFCGKIFARNSELKIHMLTHQVTSKCQNNSKSYEFIKQMGTNKREITQIKCTICLERYPNETKMAKHFVDHILKMQIKFCFCGSQFSTIESLKNHISGHFTKEYFCPICMQCFAEKPSFATHIQQNHPKPISVSCSICNEEFRDSSILQKHMRIHRHSACTLCSKTFDSEDGLARHFVEDHFSSLYLAPVCFCGKTFPRFIKLKSHMRCHVRWRCECPVCRHFFRDKADLAKHMKKVHDNTDVDKTRMSKCVLAGNGTST